MQLPRCHPPCHAIIQSGRPSVGLEENAQRIRSELFNQPVLPCGSEEMRSMDLQSRSGHKTKKKAHFSKVKALLPCKKICNMHPQPRLERSLQNITSRGCGRRKPRRHSQHRRTFIESRPCVFIGRTHGGAQISESPPVPRMRSKKRRAARSCFESSASPSLYSLHDGVNSKYAGCPDAASASALSFCSRLRARHAVSRSGGSEHIVANPHFELLSSRNPVGYTSLASLSELTIASCLPFAGSEFPHSSAAAAAGVSDTPRPQISPIILVLDSSPEANKLLGARKRTECSQEIIECLSSANLKDYCVSVAVSSNSSTSTLTSSQEASIFHHRNYEYNALKLGPEINAIPSSPNVMFQQILKDQSCGLSPLIKAETSRCEMFHIASLKEELDMLDNLRERELGLPLSWGYLDRSHNTGINEPHRYFVVIWQIQHASKYKYRLDTLFTAVSLLDRCLFSGTSVNRQMLWLLGVACMCIAVKLEETQFSSIIPVMQDICTEAAGQKPCFTKKQLIWMETVVLHIVNFECLRPTAVTFIWHYLQDHRKDRKMQALALTILCLSLTDYEVLHFPASIVAASAVFLTCLVLNKVPPLVVIENWTGYADDPMMNCVKRLDFLFAEASGSRRYTSGT